MATKDVEMKDAGAPKEEKPAPKPEDPAQVLQTDLKRNIGLLEKSVATKETRLTSRVLRTMSSIRRRLTVDALRELINSQFVVEEDTPQKRKLLSYLEKVPAKDTPAPMDTGAAKEEAKKQPKAILPEVELYIHLLVTIFLIDNKHYAEATQSSTALIERLQTLNRRTANALSAKAYFYYSRCYELTDRLEEIRANLLAAHRTACLKHNDEAQAALLNLLLRNYLHYNLYDQADKLVSKTTLKEENTSSNQYARYLYYQGRIRSIQLDYTEAYKCLLGASRKAPQNSARGFRITVLKLSTIVQLLMGEIPERAIFRTAGMKKALNPYLQLTQAVRLGDLETYEKVVTAFTALFKADKNYTLIQRLRPNVIKTGLRKINTSYSRISFADICSKLHLGNVEDAEFIVAKAIKDGVINATINHEEGYIQSKDTTDIYSSQEPLVAFDKRISFCLNIHNEAVKAMRFPPDAHKPNPETAKERREREQEIAKNLAEDDDDDF